MCMSEIIAYLQYDYGWTCEHENEEGNEEKRGTGGKLERHIYRNQLVNPSHLLEVVEHILPSEKLQVSKTLPWLRLAFTASQFRRRVSPVIKPALPA